MPAARATPAAGKPPMFYDQAHLVREVRRLTGTTPTRWARHLGRIEHGTLLR